MPFKQELNVGRQSESLCKIFFFFTEQWNVVSCVKRFRMWIIVKILVCHVKILSVYWLVTSPILRAGYLWWKHQLLLQLAIYIFSVIDIMVTDWLNLFWLQYYLVRAKIWGGQKFYLFFSKASKGWIKKNL